MKYRIATSTLAACLISFGAAMGLHAQNRYDRNDDYVQQSAVQQYAQIHRLSSNQTRDLMYRVREDQLTRDERSELLALERGTYNGNQYDNQYGNRYGREYGVGYGDQYGYTNQYQYRMGNSWRATNITGAQLLQRAVNMGYQQGFQSGQMAAQRGRGFSPQRERMWRDGTYGYENVLIGQDDYRNYFRQGFTRGYEDGFYNTNRYGSYVDGRTSVLGSVLGAILGFTIH